MLPTILFTVLLGYFLGAVPSGVLICRIFGMADPRSSGSGHTGGLNVSRQAGFWAGALTAIADAILGLVAVLGAGLLMDSPWAAALAGAMAVVGHNWSIFLRFSGGIGLSTLTGAAVAISPLPAVGAVVGLGLPWLLLISVLRFHRARATILVMAVAWLFLWVCRMPWPGVVLGALGGLAVIVKTLPDWNRQYGAHRSPSRPH